MWGEGNEKPDGRRLAESMRGDKRRNEEKGIEKGEVRRRAVIGRGEG